MPDVVPLEDDSAGAAAAAETKSVSESTEKKNGSETAGKNEPNAVPSTTQKAALQERSRRTAYEANMKNLMAKIAAVKDRLIGLRFDYSRDEDDIKRDVQNLSRELRRLESEKDALNEAEITAFEKSLKLGNLGLGKLLTGKEAPLRKSSGNLNVGSGKAEKNSSAGAGAAASAVAQDEDEDDKVEKVNKNVIDDDFIDFPTEDLKLMRTKSTETMKEKNPVEKWQGLFKMFSEWKHQDRVAAGIAASRVLDPNQKEINELRLAILTLQRRKNLGVADRETLAELQHKLKLATDRAQGKHVEDIKPTKTAYDAH